MLNQCYAQIQHIFNIYSTYIQHIQHIFNIYSTYIQLPMLSVGCRCCRSETWNLDERSPNTVFSTDGIGAFVRNLDERSPFSVFLATDGIGAFVRNLDERSPFPVFLVLGKSCVLLKMLKTWRWLRATLETVHEYCGTRNRHSGVCFVCLFAVHPLLRNSTHHGNLEQYYR